MLLKPHFGTLMPSVEVSISSPISRHYEIECEVARVLALLPSEYLAIHIRATTEFEENKGSVSKARFLELIEMCASRNTEAFFLASDNVDIQEELLSKYPDLVVLDKWFAASGEALHMSDDCPDKLANAKSALLDILLLANGSQLICNPSSCFSECARYFSPHETQVVYSVLDHSRPTKLFNRLLHKLKLVRPRL